MPKKTSGKVLLNRLHVVSRETAQGVRLFVKAESVKAMERNSIMLGFIVEEVWTMYRRKLSVDTKTEFDNHRDIN